MDISQDTFDGHHSWTFLQELDTDFIRSLQHRFSIEHHDEPDSRRHALMNLLGFLETRLKQLSAGQKLFEQVLKEDETNINAILNLQAVHEMRGEQEQVKDYKEMCSKLLNSLLHYQLKIIKARVMFEKATAMAMTEQQYKHKDHEIVEKNFKDALKLGGDLVNIQELNEWEFGLAFLYLKMDSIYRQCENKYFTNGCELFYKIATSRIESSDQVSSCSQDADNYQKSLSRRQKDLKSKSWAFLGALLGRHKKKLSDVVKTCCPLDVSFDNMQCLLKGLEINPDNAEILRRVAIGYLDENKFEDSWKYLDRAVEIQPKLGNTYRCRGLWFKKQYENTHNCTFLDGAIEQFEIARKQKCDLFALFRDLAGAYVLKGNSKNALDLCYECEQTAGGSRNADLYKLWGTILEKHGDHKGARDKRKKESELRLTIKIKDCDFGVISNCNDTTFQKTAQQIVEEIENKFDVKGYYSPRDCPPGTNMILEIGETEKNCKIIFLFLVNSSSLTMPMTEIIQTRNDEKNKNPEYEMNVIPIKFENTGKFELGCGLASFNSIIYETEDVFWQKIKQIFK